MAENAKVGEPPAIVLMRGGWRGGKSTIALYKAVELTLGYPRNRGIILRKTYPELQDATVPFVLDALEGSGGKYFKDPMKYVASNGSEILFRSAVHDGREDPSKFGSIEVGWVWIEEASEIAYGTHAYLKGRLSMPGVPRIVMLTTNPPPKRHWLYEEFEVKALPRHGNFKVSSRDNKVNLAPGYIEMLEEQYGPSWVRRYVDGDWGILMTGTAVYPEYDERLHVASEPYIASPDRPVLRGWDAHPNGLYIGVVWAQLGPNRRLHVLRSELYERTGVKAAIQSVIQTTRQRFPLMGCLDWGDPAMFIESKIEMVSIADVLQRHKIVLVPGAMAFTERREVTADWLQRLADKKPALQVNPGEETLLLRDALAGGYHWPDEKDDFQHKKVPEKNDSSHVAEAFQYLCTGMTDWLWANTNVKPPARRDVGWMGI
jgi:hypothetical protein